MSNLRPFLIALSLAMLAGCTASHPPRADVAAAQAGSGPAANDNLNAVAWTQGAIEHDLVYREVYRHAGEQLLRALADQDWDALPREEREGAVRGLAPAVILDIDETVLDNSPYQARLVRDGRRYEDASWAQWCREEAARPLPGALEFTRLAAAHGVTVFYLSNRAQDLNDATLANLRKTGFPIATAEPVFLGLGTVVEGCRAAGSNKGCRRKLIGRTHRVLLQVGDQVGDFVDVAANTAQGRAAAVAAYADWFGERWFALPNPTYGSWEAALFDNDRSLPEAGQRAAKLKNLRY
ncbi:5'-nucleotidase, lipoprotein e(P4) family [Dokdonella fugitiva]|jgi:acid phosphatase|uniref:Acid phosphatase n=1 Tax=Dokdonella fugitiva TaxID=328517 RepID=A0A4R2IEN4_9GAMM|nr:HAD family acid phosphatase [Dokdonella fugitiva]MBA8885155.1 acid phosphatase [Dokdonella fugitiva]TCO41125.1 acid phosphatase [Dokdonella fugitiva]